MSLTPEQEAAALELARTWPAGFASANDTNDLARAVLHFAEERDAAVAELAAVLEIRTETMAEREALLSDLSKACAWFAAISGALLDAGMAVSDETSYADAVRALAKERDEITDQLQYYKEADDATLHDMKGVFAERDRLNDQWSDAAKLATELSAEVTRLREQVAALHSGLGEHCYGWRSGERHCTHCDRYPIHGHASECPVGKLLAATAPPETP